MQSEHKTQIYLSTAEYRLLRRRAASEKRSMAAVIREALAAYLGSAPRGGWAGDSLASLPGIADGRPTDSADIDEVLYGGTP